MFDLKKIYLVWLFIKIPSLNNHEACHGVFSLVTCWPSESYITKFEIPVNISVKVPTITAFRIQMMQKA
jgi:hypothetical protein